MKRMLVVDTDAGSRRLVEALFAGRYEVHCVDGLAEACSLLSSAGFDVVLADMDCVKEGSGQPQLGRLVAAAGPAALVCAAAMDDAEPAYRSMRDGASGFVSKPYVPEYLESAVRKARARGVCQAGGQYGSLAQAVCPCNKQSSAHVSIVGSSAAMAQTREKIALYARSDAPVLILGETGTGKELAAGEIHRLSARSARRFQAMDCASIPEALAESELFGTVRGAFTGATERKGLFEQANGGTLFLDEVGELPYSVQAKLLRTLESRQASRLGSLNPKTYDIRLLSATNARLYGETGRFRPDLLNRINTLVLHMPPLRAHPEDIPELAESFLGALPGAKYLHAAAIDKLQAWHWPGNVRELRNTVIRAHVLSGNTVGIGYEYIETGGDSSWGGLQRMLL